MFMAIFSQLLINFWSNFEANFERRVIQLSDYENPITVMPNKNDITGKLRGVYDEFETLANNMSIAVNQYHNVSFGLLEKGRDDITGYRKDYVIGSNFIDLKSQIFEIPNDSFGWIYSSVPRYEAPESVNGLIGLYNTAPKHSRPLSVSYISNALLGHLDTSNANNRRITAANHPLPISFTVSYILWKPQSISS